MTREELEIRINDAADGMLSKAEVATMESQLRNYPDLMNDWQAIKQLPDVSSAFPIKGHDIQVHNLKKMIANEYHKLQSFDVVGWQWFRRYGAVAALVLLMVSASLRIMTQSNSEVNGTDLMWHEEIYNESNTHSQDYIIMLDELLPQE